MNKKLYFTSLWMALVLIVWISLLAFSMPAEGRPEVQIRAMDERTLLYVLDFLAALMLAPVHYLVQVQFRRTASPNRGFLFKAGKIFLIGYFLGNTIAYGSQLVIALAGEALSIPLRFSWFYFNQDSYAYFINQTGYLFWCVGTLALLWPLFGVKKALVRLITGVFYFSALLQIPGTLLYYFGLPGVYLLSTLSGALSIPAVILVLRYSFGNNWKKTTDQS